MQLPIVVPLLLNYFDPLNLMCLKVFPLQREFWTLLQAHLTVVTMRTLHSDIVFCREHHCIYLEPRLNSIYKSKLLPENIQMDWFHWIVRYKSFVLIYKSLFFHAIHTWLFLFVSDSNSDKSFSISSLQLRHNFSPFSWLNMFASKRKVSIWLEGRASDLICLFTICRSSSVHSISFNSLQSTASLVISSTGNNTSSGQFKSVCKVFKASVFNCSGAWSPTSFTKHSNLSLDSLKGSLCLSFSSFIFSIKKKKY